jgi:hypothetical protein
MRFNMFLTNTASLVQLHLLDGLSMIRVSEFSREFGSYDDLREHLLAYEGVKETDNPDVLSLKNCYSKEPDIEISSWPVVEVA